MGQDTSKVSPPPPPPPPIVDDRDDYVLSPILYVKEMFKTPRETAHVAFHKPTKCLYSVDIENPTADDSVGIPLGFKRLHDNALQEIVPCLDGHSVLFLFKFGYDSPYTMRLERLSNGMILRSSFMGSSVTSKLTPKDFLNRRPFVPVGDPRYDALACLFDFHPSPPVLPNGTEDLQSAPCSSP